MSHVHVCLVSEQTIPNILGIYHFKPDDVLFVTTSEMEQKNKVYHIIQTVKQLGHDYTARSQKITVNEGSLLDCKQQIDKWIAGKEEADFTINLTGGTKIMSIAVYDYFKDYGSKMIYIPVGKNEFIMPYPKKSANDTTELALRLSVQEYLTAYGLKVTNAKKLAANDADSQSRSAVSAWIACNYNHVKHLLERFSEKLRKHRDDKQCYQWSTAYQPKNQYETDLFHKMGFQNENSTFRKHLDCSEIGFLTGGWLEEFCYNELLQFKGRGIDDIAIGIIAEKGKTKNEFDVMFTKNNALYTVECKSLDQNDDPKADALYKIAALQKEFGLTVGSFFVSTSPHILREDGSLKFGIQARAEQFKTKVIPPQDVINFAERVAEKLKIKKKD